MSAVEMAVETSRDVLASSCTLYFVDTRIIGARLACTKRDEVSDKMARKSKVVLLMVGDATTPRVLPCNVITASEQ